MFVCVVQERLEVGGYWVVERELSGVRSPVRVMFLRSPLSIHKPHRVAILLVRNIPHFNIHLLRDMHCFHLFSIVYCVFPKKGNAKECSDYCTIALISHASKVMLKILQARLQQYMN